MRNGGEKSRLRQHIALAALVILGAYLRFDALDYNDLSRDEYGQTIRFARQIIETGDFLGWSARPDVWYHFLPRLSYSFVALAISCLGDTDGVVRFFPAFFGTAAIPLFFAVARQQLKPYAAFVCTFLFTISTMHIFYSRDARYYAYVVFFALIVQFLALRVIDCGPGRHSWRLAGLLGAFAVAAMTHWFCLFFVGGTILFLIGDRIRLRMTRWSMPRTIAVVGCAGVLMVAALALLWPVLIEIIQMNGGWQARFGTKSKGFILCALIAQSFSNAGHQVSADMALYYSRLSVFLAWGMSAAAIFGLIVALRSRRAFAILTLLWIVPPVSAIWLVNPEHFVSAKYVIFVLPMFLVCVSLTVDRLASVLDERAQLHGLQSGRIHVVCHTLLIVVVGLLSWSGISSARFVLTDRFFPDRYKEVARRIQTEMPVDIAIYNISRVPADSNWKYCDWFDGATVTLLPRYLERDGTSRTGLALSATPRWPVAQISSFDEWCRLLKTQDGCPAVVFGVGDHLHADQRLEAPDDNKHRDARLVDWVKANRLPTLDVGRPHVVEPLLQPTSDVIWTTVPAQSQATDVGLSNNRRHGVLVVPGGDFNAIARFDSAGRHEMTLSAAVPFADFAEVEIELDGRSIHREKRFGPAHQMSAATAKFVVDRPGTHDFRISVVSDEDRAPALWIDFVRVESLETPVKYAMPGFGVAALCINADDGSHRTWAMTTSLDRNMARKLWRSLDAHIRELPKGSLLFLVFKGPVSELIDAGHSQIQAILENTGGEARWIDRLRTQPGLLITGATNAFDGAARIRALPESTYRYWDAGQEPVPGGMPLPWRFGVANTRPVLPLRDPGYAAFHVPMTFVPGVFFLPTSVDTDKPYGMVESYLEGSMRNESRLKSRFSRTLDEHRVHILEKCLKPQPGVAEPVRVVSFDQFKGGEAGRGLGFPLKRVVVVEPRWTTLQQATVAGLKSSYAVHLVMQIDHPERVEGIQFVLRTPKDESILWCPVPKLFEQTAAFDFSLDEFKINEQADAADVVSAELRLISRDRKPVQVDIFDLCIVDVSRAPVIPG